MTHFDLSLAPLRCYFWEQCSVSLSYEAMSFICYIHGETSNPSKGISQFNFPFQFYSKDNKIHQEDL